jgi:hypothetical protein
MAIFTCPTCSRSLGDYADPQDGRNAVTMHLGQKHRAAPDPPVENKPANITSASRRDRAKEQRERERKEREQGKGRK